MLQVDSNDVDEIMTAQSSVYSNGSGGSGSSSSSSPAGAVDARKKIYAFVSKNNSSYHNLKPI